MKKFRFETIHLIMLGMIGLGILVLGRLLVSSISLYLALLLLITALWVLVLLYQKSSYELTAREQVALLSGQTEKNLASLLEQMPVGVIHFNQTFDDVLWYNPYAALLLTTETGDFDAETVFAFLASRQEKGASPLLHLGEKRYTVTVDTKKQLMYFWDTYSPLRDGSGLSEFSPVIAIVSVDNYDDITDRLADAEVSQLNSFVAKFIADFAGSKKIFYRRADMDRFYLFTDYYVLSDLIADNFSVLDRFRQEAKKQDLGLTLSMGIAYGNHDHQDIGKVAQNNLNMALVRGGDQVVLKDNNPEQSFQYFGGGSNATVKRSRTRTRAMMSAISDKIRLADKVFVVGHKNLDMDALAATVGMQFFAAQLTKKAYAVVDETGASEDVRRGLAALRIEDDKVFLSPSEASSLVTRRSLLIMVDHSKISLTLSEPFYRLFSDVVVVDHHRRDDDFPANASLSFIESGASSASELVTELIQFQNTTATISRLQASILMAGIMLDTKNFSARVTSRTFDVASYLRRKGSDTVEIQRLSAQNFDDYRRINQLILSGAEVAAGVIVAMGAVGDVYNQVVASKAADTLLEMAGMEASFVITQNAHGQVAVSARSKDRVNVQRIMERLGGGGHFNLAACQVEGKSLQAVRQDLLLLIQEEINGIKEN